MSLNLAAAPDPTEAMRARLQGDLRRSIKARDALETGMLRRLIAALDNAGAITPTPEPAIEGRSRSAGSPYVATGSAWGSAEAPRLILSTAEVNHLIRVEVGANANAASEMDRRGRSAEAERARSEMAIAARYLSVVDADVVEAFRRDGAVVLRGAVSNALIELLRAGIDANLSAPSPRAKIASEDGDPGAFVEDFCNWRYNDAYRRFIFESGLGQVAGTLTGAREVRLYHDHMLTKTAGTRQPTPWHQDQPYYNIEGRQTCSFWIPVDPVDRASTLEFVGGSHLGPWLMPRTFRDAQARWFPQGSLAELPDVQGNREAFDILGWALEPGDVVAFNMLTLHAAAGSSRRRRVFSVRYIGEDVRHAPRRWVTSPDFPGLEAELPAGAPMHHPLFPLVWTDS